MTNNIDNPLVSIGIPTYNRAAGNLRKVIERSLAQSYPHIEVIVSDNCSTDETPVLVQSLDDSRLRYFRQESNIGPNNNFNYCLQQARGEYFLLFHDDDMIDEDFIESCIASLKPGQTVGAVVTGVRIIDEHGDVREDHRNRAIGQSPAEFILGWFKGATALYLCNTLYNTAKLKEAGGFRSKKNLYDDLVPTFTLLAKYGRSDVAETKAAFRRHIANRGSTIPVQDWIEDSRYVLDVLCQLLPDDCQRVRRQGDQYFCKKMYKYLYNGTVASQSLTDYFRVYRAFDYGFSPLRYFYYKKRGRRLISRGGASHRPGRLARRWIRFWLRWNGIGPLGRLASRLAAWPAPPGIGQVTLAYQTPRGYIDAAATIYHSELRLGRHVYLAPGVSIYENDKGGRVSLADKVVIHRGAMLETGQEGSISIGRLCSVHPGCQIKAYVQPVVIGEGVMLAANAAIYSYDHGMAPDRLIRDQQLTAKGPVTIGDNAWIGTGAIILSGVTIGAGAVVAAGAVVTRDVPAGAITAGNPARVIKQRSAPRHHQDS